MKERPTSEELLKVIRAHCLDCCGGSRKDVRNCNIKKCNLWPYRKTERKKEEKEIEGQMTIFDYEQIEEAGEATLSVGLHDKDRIIAYGHNGARMPKRRKVQLTKR